MAKSTRSRDDIDASRQAWEDWGTLDPLWAILTEPDMRFGRWDLDAFFASGRDHIAAIMADAQRLGHPLRAPRRSISGAVSVG